MSKHNLSPSQMRGNNNINCVYLPSPTGKTIDSKWSTEAANGRCGDSCFFSKSLNNITMQEGTEALGYCHFDYGSAGPEWLIKLYRNDSGKVETLSVFDPMQCEWDWCKSGLTTVVLLYNATRHEGKERRRKEMNTMKMDAAGDCIVIYFWKHSQ